MDYICCRTLSSVSQYYHIIGSILISVLSSTRVSDWDMNWPNQNPELRGYFTQIFGWQIILLSKFCLLPLVYHCGTSMTYLRKQPIAQQWLNHQWLHFFRPPPNSLSPWWLQYCISHQGSDSCPWMLWGKNSPRTHIHVCSPQWLWSFFTNTSL